MKRSWSRSSISYIGSGRMGTPFSTKANSYLLRLKVQTSTMDIIFIVFYPQHATEKSLKSFPYMISCRAHPASRPLIGSSFWSNTNIIPLMDMLLPSSFNNINCSPFTTRRPQGSLPLSYWCLRASLSWISACHLFAEGTTISLLVDKPNVLRNILSPTNDTVILYIQLLLARFSSHQVCNIHAWPTQISQVETHGYHVFHPV